MSKSNRLQTYDDKRDFSLFVPITKVDLERREVWGQATAEVPDHVKEILDYKSSKPLIQKWSDAARERSNVPGVEPSLGNIREMHEPIAAGKVIAINFDDDQRTVDIGTKCSNPTTWQKILDGTLTGFSLGGHYKERWMDPANPRLYRYTAEPVEISYVDVPAVPTATFYQVVKMDGAIEMRKLGDPVIPATGETSVIVESPEFVDSTNAEIAHQSLDTIRNGEAVTEIPSVGDVPTPSFGDANRAVEPINSPKAGPVEKAVIDMAAALPIIKEFSAAVNSLASMRQQDTERQLTIEKHLKGLGDRVGIARKADTPSAAPSGYPTNPEDYADPANWSWACDKDRAAAAVGKFNVGEGLAKYEVKECHVLGRRVARLASRFGDTFRYDPQTRKVQKEVTKMGKTNEILVKTELDALMAQVQSEVDVAADKLGVDPAAFRALLANALAQAESDTATDTVDTETGEPTAPTGSQSEADVTALKAAAPATVGDTASVSTGSSVSSPGSPSSAGTTPASTDEATAKAETPVSTGAGSGLPTMTAASTPDGMAAMAAKVDQLEGMMKTILEKLGADVKADPRAIVHKVADVAPAGNLAALVDAVVATASDEDAMLKALTSGHKDAFRQAAIAAGAKDAPNEQAVVSGAYQAAADSLGPQFKKRLGLPGFLESLSGPQ